MPFNPFLDDGIVDYTVRSLIKTRDYLKAHPQAVIYVGRWPAREMHWQEWHQWFIDYLNAKINRNEKRRGKKDSEQYQIDLRHDVELIREYHTTRIRRCGHGLLRTPEAKRLYPHINCNPWEPF